MRALSVTFGVAAIWVAMASPLAMLDHRMLTAHMVQHLLLMTIAPPLLWLGVRVPQQRWPLAVCWLPAALVLIACHVPAVFRLPMESGAWHLAEQLSFLVSGLLFWWPVFQMPPRWSILLYLFLATLPCDVLSAFLVFSGRIAYPGYVCGPAHDAASVLSDQQCAGALMWTVVTLVYLVAGTVFAAQLLSVQTHEQTLEAM
jgi:cytochrome c oxidase assembly factor CtaG